MNLPLKHRLLKFWRDYARPFLVIATVLMACRSSIADWNDVPTGSMKPSIVEGDRIFVNKLAYDLKVPFTTWHLATWSQPQRGDVVVFFSPADGIRLVKRVVGLPGDRIEMREGQLIINGQTASYGALEDDLKNAIPAEEQPHHQFSKEGIGNQTHPVMRTPELRQPSRFPEITVPAGHYFMMGDNRDNSSDSRVFGPVDRDLIVGRASGVVASFDLKAYLKPRWGRFFKGLP